METVSVEEKRITREKVAKPLLYISMVGMLMIFASLTSAYIVRQKKGDWLNFELPQMFYISTAIIIISSVSINWALAAAKKNDFKSVKWAALTTLLLGVAFTITQFQAWGALVDQKVFFAGKYSNASGSFLYVLTGLHLAHLFGGIIAVFVVWIKSIQQKYNSENLLGIRLCAIFWHFLDLLWIYLFVFLLFQR
ncbi:MAG: cytochrome c oxidase subunit 3 [Bacteroidetes bacterium]|jgi:cytochrome c oxidase subunit 3|nr:cytochrome c oxidase subunit 3 [Bacteroidota bacterium]